MSSVTFGTINTLVQEFRSIYAGEDLYETETVGELTHDALHVHLGLNISEWGEQQITTYHFGVCGIPFHLIPPIGGHTSFSKEEWGTLWDWYQKGLNEDSDWSEWLQKYSPLPLLGINVDTLKEGIEALQEIFPEHSKNVLQVIEDMGFN